MGHKEDEGHGSATALIGGVLEERGPSDAGVWLPGVALRPHSQSIPLTGPGSEGGYGSYNGPLGAITHPPAGAVRAPATCSASDKTLQTFCPPYGHRFKAHRHVYLYRQHTKKRKTYKKVQRAAG